MDPAKPRYPRFSTPTSEDRPNFQLAFWRECIRQFDRLRTYVDDNGFAASQFAERAAVVIVLAGAGLDCLLGQHDPNPPTPERPQHVPSPRDLASKLSLDSDPDLQAFRRLYDAVRHFADRKHDLVRMLTEEGLRST